MNRLRYWQLTQPQRDQARAMFLDAGTGDGYWYELGQDGNVLCRNRRLIDQINEQYRDLEGRITAARGTA